MTRLTRAVTGARWGALAGFLFFSADLAGTFAAIGWMFVWTWAGVLLLGCAAVSATVLGACAGALVFAALPPAKRVLPWRWARAAVIPICWVCIAIAAFVARSDWNIDMQPAPAAVASSNPPAPILWVIADTLRADVAHGDDLSFPHMPNLAQFARDAVVFSDAESTAGWTIPSSVALFTGVHHTTAGASDTTLPHWATTAAEHLHAAGYETRAVVDNPTLDRRNGFAAGFQSFEHQSAYRFAFSLPSFRVMPEWVREKLRFSFPVLYLGAPGLTDAAIRRIDSSSGTAPLFLYVHYMDPHAPYYPHPELAADPPGVEPFDFWRVRDQLRRHPYRVQPEEAQLQLLRNRYAAEATYLDRQMGRLLAAWEKKFGDRGVVVFTSDHGEEFFEHGRLSHGSTVHRELVHVPLILRAPAGSLPEGGASGRRDTPVSHLEVLPTTLELARVAPTEAEGPAIQGLSLVPWLSGQAPAPTRALMANHGRHGRDVLRYREGDLVYMQSMYFDGRPPEFALYDLASDPTEQNDLFREKTEIAQRLKSGMHVRMDLLRRAYTYDPRQVEGDSEGLKALGYIQ